MGGGSWATALAKLMLQSQPAITWYMRRDDRIDDFKRLRHNPAYLTDVEFDIDRIDFSSDINYVCNKADTLLLVMPSPYFKDHADKITADISRKNIVSAVKGIVPDTNELITDYMTRVFGTAPDRTLVVSAPAMPRRSPSTAPAISPSAAMTLSAPRLSPTASEARTHTPSHRAMSTVSSMPPCLKMSMQ